MYSALLGGALIGLSASLLLYFNGRIAGISGIVGGLLSGWKEAGWRATFVLGLLAGGGVFAIVKPPVFGSVSASPALLIASGLLVGIGTELGRGCTSGHGVCGISRFSGRSVAATLTFMFTGVLATFVVRHLLGGPP